MVLGKMDIHTIKIKLGLYLIPLTKINLKWAKGLNVKTGNHKMSRRKQKKKASSNESWP